MGFSQIFMDFHGIFIGFSMFFMGFSQIFYGFSWDFHRIFHVFHGIFTDFYGFSWDFHRCLWIFMGFSQMFMDFHGIFHVFHGIFMGFSPSPRPAPALITAFPLQAPASHLGRQLRIAGVHLAVHRGPRLGRHALIELLQGLAEGREQLMGLEVV